MSLPYFDIKSNEPTSLAPYGEGTIVIRRVEVIEGQGGLFSPVQVSTTLPTGEGYQYYFHPQQFHSRDSTRQITVEMNVEIRYSRYTKLFISSIYKTPVVYRIYYTKTEGERPKVLVNEDLDGYTFSLNPKAKEIILSRFKEAKPVRNIFVGYSTKASFESIYGKIEEYIIPALMDLNLSQIGDLGGYILIDARTGKEILNKEFATEKNNNHLYVGRAGHLACMAECLSRYWNVAIPEVDVGEDIFVVEDATSRLVKVQVKTASGKKIKKGFSAQFLIPIKQLEDNTEKGNDLRFIFVTRFRDIWQHFITITREDLSRKRVQEYIGSPTKKEQLRITLYFIYESESENTVSKVECGIQRGFSSKEKQNSKSDFSAYINNWEGVFFKPRKIDSSDIKVLPPQDQDLTASSVLITENIEPI